MQSARPRMGQGTRRGWFRMLLFSALALVVGGAPVRADGPGVAAARPERTLDELLGTLARAADAATREEAAGALARRYGADAGPSACAERRLAPELIACLRDEPDPRVRRRLLALLGHLQARGQMTRGALTTRIVPDRLSFVPGAVGLARLADLYEDPHLTPHLLAALLAGLAQRDALDREEALAGLETFYARHLADAGFAAERILTPVAERLLADPSRAVRRCAFGVLSRLLALDPVRVGAAVERLIDERRGPEPLRRARAAACLATLLIPYDPEARDPAGGIPPARRSAPSDADTVITLFKILIPPLLFVDLEGDEGPDEARADPRALAPAEAEALKARVRRLFRPASTAK